MSTLETATFALGRDVALELVRVTEAGALAAGRWVARGDKEGHYRRSTLTRRPLPPRHADTQSILMRASTGTTRLIDAQHRHY